MLMVHRVTFKYLNEINLKAPLNMGWELDSVFDSPLTPSFLTALV